MIAGLILIIGLLMLCVFWPLGVLLILIAMAWAIVFRKTTVIVNGPSQQPQSSGRFMLFVLFCIVAALLSIYFWEDLSRWSVLR